MIKKSMNGRFAPLSAMDRVEARAPVVAEAHADAARVKLAGFVGLAVEVRTFAGVVSHGVLIAVTRLYAVVEHRTGRLAVVELAAVAACCEESSA